tara:strand:+ start:338 stop:547 length:210 start_codon:yes stop_codon:yes gene_type:complete
MLSHGFSQCKLLANIVSVFLSMEIAFMVEASKCLGICVTEENEPAILALSKKAPLFLMLRTSTDPADRL